MKKKIAVLMLGIIASGLVMSGCGSSNSDNKDSVMTAEENIDKGEKVMNLLNPIAGVEEDTWYDYGTGDPYIMRYNGMYYLYISTRDTEVGIKCFSSRDLINWKYEGLCATEDITKGAYAPEVVYYNGMFYMYSSPAGNGHYVFSSASPIGPFKTVTENLGFSIDGSVFIDNDGKWYFYHSSDMGIQAHEMTSPSEISFRAIDVNASMHGWTEGPMVIQHDGKYYLTYTGNHVFSKGYRINYGVGESPTKFTPSAENPILLHTLGDLYGIGHSSSVKGPDLDSYYIAYHSLVGRAVEGMPKRVMNIDRIVFNGDRMDVLGPTITEQQYPNMPDIYAYFQEEKELEAWESKNAQIVDGALLLEKKGIILSCESLGEQFTAEYNVSSKDTKGKFGGYFSYADKKNYGSFILDSEKQSVEFKLVQEGKENKITFELITSFDEPVNLNANQSFQIEKKNEKYVIYFNDRYLGEFECGLAGGKIGYFVEGCKAQFGFIGGSSVSGGMSACTYEKPLPGTIQGIHYKACSEQMAEVEGYAKATSVVTKAEENYLDYKVRVEQNGAYDFSMLYSVAKDAFYALFLDGDLVTKEKEALASTGSQGEYATSVLRNINLTEGVHTLRIALYGEEIALSQFVVAKHEEVEEFSLTFDSILDDNIYFDGKWRIKDGVLKLDDAQKVGKRLYGSENLGDYTVEADMEFVDGRMDAGLIFRVKNPALGGAGDSAVAGMNFIQGYYAAIENDQLVLAKVNYEYEKLASIPMEFEKNRKYHISVTVDGTTISICVDGVEYIVYEDNIYPFLQGAAGVCSRYSTVNVDNLKINAIANLH